MFMQIENCNYMTTCILICYIRHERTLIFYCVYVTPSFNDSMPYHDWSVSKYTCVLLKDGAPLRTLRR